jgi:hypothetical protein
VLRAGGADVVNVIEVIILKARWRDRDATLDLAPLSISVLTAPSSLTLVTIPPGWAALGIWKPIMWNCSPNRFSLGGRVWQALH